MSRKGADLSTNYHECSKQPKDWHGGNFDAKWQEKELHKKRLVKSNTGLTLQDITAKLNECKVSEKENGGSGSESKKASKVV